jgi:hypothetical protein
LEDLRGQDHDVHGAEEWLEAFGFADLGEPLRLQKGEPGPGAGDGGNERECSLGLRDQQDLRLDLERVECRDKPLELRELACVHQRPPLYRLERGCKLPQGTVLGAVKRPQEFRVHFQLV